MNRRGDPGASASAAQAVERVLGAEQAAQSALEAARERARVLREAAHDDGLAIVNRSMERVQRWQQGHAAALAQRLAALSEQAAVAASGPAGPDAAAVDAAAEALARHLTTATGSSL